MPHVTNLTPFRALVVEHRVDGRLDHCLFVKATFRLSQGGRLLPLMRQPAFVIADVHEGDARTTALRQACETVPCKPATDIVVVGHARPARSLPVPRWFAHVAVGAMQKTVMLTGPRHWRHRLLKGWTLSEPEPVAAVPLSYALAFGGASATRRDDVRDVYWPNPFGRGYRGRDAADAGMAYPAPQILPPSACDLAWGGVAESVGLSPVAVRQFARLQWAACVDAAQGDEVGAIRPEFWNTVPQDQVARPHLRGDEQVRTSGLFPTGDGEMSFALPRYDVLAVPVGGPAGPEPPQAMPLDTVQIDLDRGEVMLRWAVCYAQSLGYARYEVIALDREPDGARPWGF